MRGALQVGHTLRRKAIYGAISACVLMTASQFTQAATFTWDTNSNSSGFGSPATGNWGTAVNNWSSSTAGTAATVAWTNAANTAEFRTDGSSTPGTVTLVNAIQASGITITSGSGWVIAPTDGTTTLSTFTSSGVFAISTAAGTSVTINAIIANNGTTTISKTGTGTLFLGGQNTQTGQTTISAGTLEILTTGKLSSGVTTNFGTTFNLDTTATTTANRVGIITMQAGTFNVIATGSGVDTLDQSSSRLTLNAGLASINVTPDSGKKSTFLFQGNPSLTRNVGGVVTFTGTSLGTGTGAIITFLNSPTLTGGTLGTTSAKLLPYALADTTAGGVGTGFATWVTGTGIRPIVDGTENTSTFTTGVNIRLTSSVGSTTGITINSLVLDNLGSTGVTLPISGTMTVTSGGILTRGTASSGTNTLSGGTLAFGAAEAIFHAQSDLNITSNLTGTGGMSKSGAGTLKFTGSTLPTGQFTMEQGTFDLSGTNQSVGTLFGYQGTITNSAPSTTSVFTTTLTSAGNIYSGSFTDGPSGAKLALIFNLNSTPGSGVNLDISSSTISNTGDTVLQGTNRGLLKIGSKVLPGTLTLQGGGMAESGGTIANVIKLGTNGTFTSGNEQAQAALTFSNTMSPDNAGGFGTFTWYLGVMSSHKITYSGAFSDTVATDTMVFSSINDTVGSGLDTTGFYIQGSNANSFAGTMRIESYVLSLNKSGAGLNAAVSGNLVIGNGTSHTAANNTVASTILRASNQIADTSIVTVANDNSGTGRAVGAFDLNNQSETIGGLASTGSGSPGYVGQSNSTGTATLTISPGISVSNDFSGVLANRVPTAVNSGGTALNFSTATTGKLNIVKDGAGTQSLSGTSEYTGTTSVLGGKLTIASTGNINTTSGLTINGSTANFNYNSSTAFTPAITFGAGGGTLSGNGTISSTGGINVANGGVISPGNSPGSQIYTTGLSFASGTTYRWEHNAGNALGAAGASINGFDQIIINGGSGLTIASGAKLSLNFDVSTDFSNTFWDNARTWTVASYLSGSATTGFFATGDILLSGSSASYSNAGPSVSGQGDFSTSLSSNNLILTWTPVPSVTSTTYSLSATAGSVDVLRNGKTGITSTITNTGGAGTDDLNFTGLVAVSGVGGTLSGSSTSGGPLAGNGANGSASNSGNLVFKGISYGNISVTPVVGTATNATISGNATNSGTTPASINVGQANAWSAAADRNSFGTVLSAELAASDSYANLSSKVTAATLGTLDGAAALLSEATILEGTAGVARTVTMAWRTRNLDEVYPSASNPPFNGPDSGVFSDVVLVSGTGSDVYTLQMTYDGSISDLVPNLGWLDGTEHWVNAGSAGSPDTDGYNPGTDFVLGNWGYDLANHTVWAVVDHGGQFAAVPEPTTMSVLGLGVAGLLSRRRRK